MVSDPTGAAVPNAAVQAKNPQTGLTRSTKTAGSGDYTISNLPPGTYDVTATATGFSATMARVTLTVGTRSTRDFKMELGQQTEVVTISAEAHYVNVENQTNQTSISTRTLSELPSLTRNPYDFVMTAGGVSEQDAGMQERGVGVNINGQRAASTNVLLDGASNNDEYIAGVGQPVPLDSVQEYSILTSNFTAEFGRASGGVVNVVTKSGTNEWHGTAYAYNRVSALAANTFDNNANGLARPGFTRNQFGFSGGGALVKNKLFVFENTEWTRVRSSATETGLIPTSTFLASTAPATQAFFAAYGKQRPGVQILGPVSGLDGFQKVAFNVPADAGAGNPQNTYNLVARADYNLDEKTQMYFRYARYSQDEFKGTIVFSPYQGFDSGETNMDNSLLFSVTRTFSPRFVSQSKIAFMRLTQQQPLGDNPVVPTLYFSSAGPASYNGTTFDLPGYSQRTPGNSIPFGGPQNLGQIYQDFSFNFGKHALRFGGMYERIWDNRTFGAYEEAVEALTNAGPNSTAINNLKLGQLARFEVAINPQGKYPCTDFSNPTAACTVNLPLTSPSFSRSNLYNNPALYIQDAWKVAPRFTVSLGLRWEFFGVQHNKNPQLDSNFYDAAGKEDTAQGVAGGSLQVAPNSRYGQLWRSDYRNFGPRVGFAWDLFGDGKTSLRGGYGRFYERNFGNVTYNVIQNPPAQYIADIRAPRDVASMPITVGNLGLFSGTSGTIPLRPASTRNVDANISTAYAHVWNFSLEHQLPHGIVGAVEYSGSKGMNLYSLVNYNALGYGNVYLGVPCSYDAGDCTARLYDGVATMNRRGNLGYSNYDGLNFRFAVNNVAHAGITLLANYTWSHALDNSSSTFSDAGITSNGGTQSLGLLDPFHPGLDYGNADFDARHRFVVSALWEIPAFKHRKDFAGQVLGGWTLAPIFVTHSGLPFSVYDCTNADNVCPYAAFNGAINTTGSTTPRSVDVNTYAYVSIPAKQVDNFDNPKYYYSDMYPFPSNMSTRNTFRGPRFYNVNFGFFKNFQISDRVRLQFRGESYNLFNHANMWVAGANTDVSSMPTLTDGSPYISSKKGCEAFGLGCNTDHRNIQLAIRVTF